MTRVTESFDESEDFRPMKKIVAKRKRDVDFDKLRTKQFEKRRDKHRHHKGQDQF